MVVKLAMHTGTFNYKSLALESVFQPISESGFTGINIRDNHIREYIEKGHSIRDVKALCQKHQLHPVALDAVTEWQCWGSDGSSMSQSSPFGSKEESRKYAEQFIQECVEVGCDFVVCTTLHEQRDVGRDIRAFKELCDLAKGYDARMALEFLPYAAVKEIKTTWEIVREANRSNGGLLIDTFHFFTGGSRIDDLREVPPEKIFFIHCDDAPDLALDPKRLAKNRAFPGDGVFPLFDFFDVILLEKGFKGWVSLEVLNDDNPKHDPFEIARKGKESLDRLLERYR